MAGASISHVLIVAGPSGAGKSAFLSELAAGRLPDEIANLLPEGADTWDEVCSNLSGEWSHLLDGDTDNGPLSGVAVHYDVTSMWLHLGDELQHDPFWDVLKHCAAATVVKIRPTRKRLIRQWIRVHLGVSRLWAAHYMAVWTEFTAKMLVRLRPWVARFSKPEPDPSRRPWQNRFLTVWDFWVIVRLHKLKAFRFYRDKTASVEQMMKSWEKVTATLLAGVPTTHIELAPERDSRIAKQFRWRVVRVNSARTSRRASAAAERAHSTVTALVTAASALC